MSDKSEKIRSMADLLRSGATMIDLACPACASPLFKLKSGEIWCAQCQKRVVVVKEEEEVEETKSLVALGAVESTLLGKIQEINEKIQGEKDIEELRRLSVVMSTLLENLEKVRKMSRRAA